MVATSWTLTVAELKDYVISLGNAKPDVRVTNIYVATSVGSSNNRHGYVGGRDMNLVWQKYSNRTNSRLANMILAKSVETDLIDDVATFMSEEN